MNARERKLWRAFQKRVLGETPAMNKAMLDSFENLLRLMTTAEMEAALAQPDTFAETVLSDARMRQAFVEVRQELARQTRDAVLWFVPQLPGGGVINGVVVVGFNTLDPRVIEGIRKLESRVMVTLRDQAREAMRVVVQKGLAEGAPHRTIARQVRSIVGLAPNQELAVANFTEALRTGDFTKALGYELRDRRYDGTLRRLRETAGELSAEQVDDMATAYRRKFLSWNAEVNARTAVTDAQRLGKHLATQEAINAGLLDGTRMRSRWVSTGDSRVRPEHVAVHGEVVRFGEPFSTGEVIPGESTFNCFPGETVVEGAMVAGLKASYSGPFREVRTAAGHRLTVTPNHPILTPGGWVPAHQLQEGSALLAYAPGVVGRGAAGDMDGQQGPATIQEVFDALGAQGTKAVALLRGDDFHGDAIHAGAQVEVVAADAHLLHHLGASFRDGLDDRRFSGADVGAPLASGSGHALALETAVAVGSDGSVGGTDLASDGGGVLLDRPPLQALRIGPAADWNASVPQAPFKDDASVSAFVAQLLEASAGAVAVDQVTEVRDIQPAVVHVYDLQAVGGWIIAGGVVCSNCRCIKEDFQVAAAAAA